MYPILLIPLLVAAALTPAALRRACRFGGYPIPSVPRAIVTGLLMLGALAIVPVIAFQLVQWARLASEFFAFLPVRAWLALVWSGTFSGTFAAVTVVVLFMLRLDLWRATLISLHTGSVVAGWMLLGLVLLYAMGLLAWPVLSLVL